MSLSDKYEWMDRGLCREIGPDLFLSEDCHTGRKAKEVCRRCPVINECLSWAIENPDILGVLGGTTPRERQTLRGLRRGQNRKQLTA